jgi:hypothetical protein
MLRNSRRAPTATFYKLDILDKPTRIETMQVKIGGGALRNFDELPTTMQDRVLSVIERLKNWPAVSGAKGLTGNWPTHPHG